MISYYQTLLNKHGLTLKKCFGQNFIFDDEFLDELVARAGVTEKDVVVEIGCGAGTLTRALLKKAKRVIGYEIDTRLKPILEDLMHENPNLTVNFTDVMKENLTLLENSIGERYMLVANLPYYITTPIVMNFLENAKNISGMAIMVQKEVAERFASIPSTTDYGAITVGINLRGSAEIIMHAGREMFTPPPNVDSAVVKINVDRTKFCGEDLEKVRKLVKIAFTSRRKTLINNLINGLKLSREQATLAVLDANISETARAENLSAEEFVLLSKVLGELL